MTPSEKNIVRSLVAVAWADGTVKEPEVGMIDSLLWAFGASEEDEAEIKEFAKKKRTIKVDVPLERSRTKRTASCSWRTPRCSRTPTANKPKPKKRS